MYNALKELMKEDIQEEKDNVMLTAIVNLMNNMKLTAEQAMSVLGVPQDDRPRYSARL